MIQVPLKSSSIKRQRSSAGSGPRAGQPCVGCAGKNGVVNGLVRIGQNMGLM